MIALAKLALRGTGSTPLAPLADSAEAAAGHSVLSSLVSDEALHTPPCPPLPGHLGDTSPTLPRHFLDTS